MKTDIEIALEADMQPIQDVASKLEITPDELDLYGKYKAKLTDELWEKVKDPVLLKEFAAAIHTKA